MRARPGPSSWSRRLAFLSLAALGSFAALALLAAGDAAAAKARVGVATFAGTGEGPIRAKVLKALKAAGYSIVGGQQIESTAAKAGAALDSDDGWRAVARELNVAAFVTGEISRRKAALAVRNGADGAVIGEAAFAGPNAKKIAAAVGAGFWKQLGPAVKRGQPPAGAKSKAAIVEEAEPADSVPDEGEPAAASPAVAAEEPPAETPPPPEKPKKSPRRVAAVEKASDDDSGGETAGDEDSDVKPRKKDKHRAQARTKAGAKNKTKASKKAEADDEEEDLDDILPVALALGGGGRALFRNVTWNQDVMKRFGPYALSPGPEAALWLDFFPASFFTGAFAANVGLFGSFNYGFGVTSMTTSGSSLTTTFQDYTAGLKVRFPLGAFTPFVSAAYGAQTFKLGAQSTGGGGTSPLPSFEYRLLRAGGGARIAFTPLVSAELGAAFLLPTDVGSKSGDIGSTALFPHAKAYGVDAGLSVAVRVFGPLAARLGADFRQYGLDFHVRSNSDPAIVGGATDRYISVWGGVELQLDGMPTESSSDDDDDAHDTDNSEPPAKKAAPSDDDAN